jgi:hypothetical protein
VDAVLAVALALLLLFPVASRLTAASLPVTPASGPSLPTLPRSGRAPSLSNLPMFIALSPARVAASTARTADVLPEVHRLVRDLFGRRRGAAFDAVLASPLGSPAVDLRVPSFSVAQTATANDLAAMLLLIASGERSGHGLANAGPVALFLLQRDRRAGACAPALNYAFLLAAATPTFAPGARGVSVAAGAVEWRQRGGDAGDLHGGAEDVPA